LLFDWDLDVFLFFNSKGTEMGSLVKFEGEKWRCSGIISLISLKSFSSISERSNLGVNLLRFLRISTFFFFMSCLKPHSSQMYLWMLAASCSSHITCIREVAFSSFILLGQQRISKLLFFARCFRHIYCIYIMKWTNLC